MMIEYSFLINWLLMIDWRLWLIDCRLLMIADCRSQDEWWKRIDAWWLVIGSWWWMIDSHAIHATAARQCEKTANLTQHCTRLHRKYIARVTIVRCIVRIARYRKIHITHCRIYLTCLTQSRWLLRNMFEFHCICRCSRVFPRVSWAFLQKNPKKSKKIKKNPQKKNPKKSKNVSSSYAPLTGLTGFLTLSYAILRVSKSEKIWNIFCFLKNLKKKEILRYLTLSYAILRVSGIDPVFFC